MPLCVLWLFAAEKSAVACNMCTLCIKCLGGINYSLFLNIQMPYRYMLGDDGQSLYVVFMGTKHMRDLLADANLLQEAVWKSENPDKQQVMTTSRLPAWQPCCACSWGS